MKKLTLQDTVQFSPAPGYVLIEPIEREHYGGLSISQRDAEPPKKGMVLAVGASVTTEYGAVINSPVKMGQIIFHTTIGFEEFLIDVKKYRIVPFKNILGVYL
jgi:co-chaperonin GroES (HSP10)